MSLRPSAACSAPHLHTSPSAIVVAPPHDLT